MKNIATVPSPRLDVRDLRVALALSRAGTTARASDILHLTQPAVSRALLALEDKLGARVFERTARGLVPTAAGERLLERAAHLLVELDDLERRVRAVERPKRLRLVCQCYTAYHWLPSMLVALRRGLDELEITLAVEHTEAPVEALEAGAIDVALLTQSTVPRSVEQRALFSDEIVFLVAASHPLAAVPALARAHLCEHTLVTSRAPAEESRWFMRKVFGRARPRIRLERIPLTEAVLDVTRAGLGIAILSEWVATPHLGKGDLVVKRLASGPLRRPWRFAFRRESRDAALRLLAALRATVPRAQIV